MAEVIVADASVVAKWFLKEEWRDNAINLRNDYVEGRIDLAAPCIMPFEVLNAIRYSKREIETEVLEGIAESLSLYGIKLYELKGDYAKKTVKLSIRKNISIYDASYLALAIELKAKLYTADEKLIEKLDAEDRKYVKHIKTYSRIE
ncbi:PIN domain nuclease [Candidatus Geothermarchaeota archaeon]|nr:MAG: PIN domain nuclease [Candidatus Geothermarchaeota archaeon]HEW94003.1 PIN domain-containing protein [Thermoprotei archaeon]